MPNGARYIVMSVSAGAVTVKLTSPAYTTPPIAQPAACSAALAFLKVSPPQTAE